MRTTCLRIIAAVLLLAAGLPFAVQAQTDVPSASQTPQVRKAPEKPEVRTEEIHPAPRNIRERTAIIVFIVWLWGSIAALLAVLRLKIREVDRVEEFEHISRPDAPPKEPPVR